MKHERELPVLSDTRWLTRVDSIHCLYNHYGALCDALEAVRNCSTGSSASDAEAFLKQLQSSEFLASAIICRHVLAFTRPLTVALQAKDCDLSQCLVKSLEHERDPAKFHVLWQRITDIAARLNMEPARST